MGNLHNKERYGEVWPQYRIDACKKELEKIKPYVTLSGGWAWHFMSPLNHTEYKHSHDHKDIDLFVEPENIAVVVSLLKSRGFKKVWTKYDKLPSSEDFRRYEKRHFFKDGSSVKITIDFFVRSDVPIREIDGWRLTEPSFLLSLYGRIHSSDNCFAVKAASKLIHSGIDPVGRRELTELPVHAESDRDT
ncbi:hypothetical protein QUF72_18545 [Desulfobacterales bacterium HSG2]|nr:hypothetical protein [Desulfobacterales bacterium HSG2]